MTDLLRPRDSGASARYSLGVSVGLGFGFCLRFWFGFNFDFVYVPHFSVERPNRRSVVTAKRRIAAKISVSIGSTSRTYHMSSPDVLSGLALGASV